MSNSDNTEFILGQKVKFRHKYSDERAVNIIQGKVIYKNDYFITLKTKNYNTSINLIDLKIGTAVLLKA